MKFRDWFWAITGIILILLGILLIQSAQAVRDINSPYHDVEETERLSDETARAYGGIEEEIGRTIEGRPIYLYKFGSGPSFLFDGRLHGPEDCGTEAGLDFIRYVYSSDDQEALNIRENVTLLFIPIINKDRPLSRVNARGVNLNRNFPRGWATSGSTNPTSEDYIGQYPASEPETRALMKAIDDYDVRVYFNVHCGMRVMYGGGNLSMSKKLYDKLLTLDSRPTFKKYVPYYKQSCGTGGYSKAYACDENTSSWLYEIASWPDLPDTEELFYREWRPVYLPLYKAAALSIVTQKKGGVINYPSNQSNSSPSPNIKNLTFNVSVNKTKPPVVLLNNTRQNVTKNDTKRFEDKKTSWIQRLANLLRKYKTRTETVQRFEVEKVRI